MDISLCQITKNGNHQKRSLNQYYPPGQRVALQDPSQVSFGSCPHITVTCRPTHICAVGVPSLDRRHPEDTVSHEVKVPWTYRTWCRTDDTPDVWHLSVQRVGSTTPTGNMVVKIPKWQKWAAKLQDDTQTTPEPHLRRTSEYLLSGSKLGFTTGQTSSN